MLELSLALLDKAIEQYVIFLLEVRISREFNV